MTPHPQERDPAQRIGEQPGLDPEIPVFMNGHEPRPIAKQPFIGYIELENNRLREITERQRKRILMLEAILAGTAAIALLGLCTAIARGLVP